MTNKLELFNQIVRYLEGSTMVAPRISKGEDCIVYHFPIDKEQIDIEPAKAIFKEFGYKGDDVKRKILDKYNPPLPDFLKELNMENEGTPPLHVTNISILYNYERDKINVSYYEFGFGYKWKEKRFYPHLISKPVLTYTKHIYAFGRTNKDIVHKKGKLIVRIAKGSDTGDYYSLHPHYNAIKNIMMGLPLNYKGQIKVPCRYYFGVKDDIEVIEKIHAVKIPKVLHRFDAKDVETLYKTLKDHKEVTRICMFLGHLDTDARTKLRKDMLLAIVGHVMGFNDYAGNAWMVRDYIRQLAILKMKFSLKMTSKKRLEYEHNTLTKMIQIRGIKEIKVDKIYKKMFKSFPIPDSELIENKERLLKEGLDQDHCVASYGEQINSGQSCIISVPYQGKQWTLQVSKQNYYKSVKLDGSEAVMGERFVVNQFKGYRNQAVPEELEKQVKDFISSVVIVLEPSKTPIVESVSEVEFEPVF